MSTSPTWREALEFAAETKNTDWPERCQKMVDMARKALMSDLKQKPIAWTLKETIDAKGSLYRSPLWFTDPQNSSWVPLYTTGAPPESMDPDVRDAKHQLREVLGLPQTFDDWELNKVMLLAVERIVALRNSKQAEAVPPDVEVIRKALDRAFIMGQNYWADADSESYSANKRSDVTRQKFNAMRDEVCAAIAQQKGQP